MVEYIYPLIIYYSWQKQHFKSIFRICKARRTHPWSYSIYSLAFYHDV